MPGDEGCESLGCAQLRLSRTRHRTPQKHPWKSPTSHTLVRHTSGCARNTSLMTSTNSFAMAMPSAGVSDTSQCNNRSYSDVSAAFVASAVEDDGFASELFVDDGGAAAA